MKKAIFIFTLAAITHLVIACQQEEAQSNPQDSYIKNPTIDNKLQLQHLGEVTFMNEYISINEYCEADFIGSIDIYQGSSESVNLNIRAFLDNTLTNHLKKLNPTASITELVTNGNYQFTFIVDGKKVYTENLNTGAGSAYSKNRNTSLCIPLYSSKEEDSWGRFMWMRFLYRNGGEEALTEGSHILTLEIRPYLEMDDLKIGALMASGSIEINVISDELNIDQSMLPIQAIANHPDLAICNTPLDDNYISNMNKKIASNIYKDITSIIVLNEGKIALEQYFNGSNRSTLHDTRSVGKSFVGTLLGMAIEDGYIEDEMQTLDQFYDLEKYSNFSIEKTQVTLQDLLTMSSSIDGSDIDGSSLGHEERMYPTHDWVEFALDLKTKDKSKTNTQWDYFTAGTVILGDILDKSIPKGLEAYAQDKLFDALNIKNHQWQYTPKKVVNTAGGLQLNSIDLAKYGYLYQNKGIWNNTNIIHENWINKSFTQHRKLPKMIEGNYGYLFWNMEVRVNDSPQQIFYASGNGGNKVFIFKDLPYVVIITSTAYNTPYAEKQANQILTEHIIPSLEKL